MKYQRDKNLYLSFEKYVWPALAGVRRKRDRENELVLDVDGGVLVVTRRPASRFDSIDSTSAQVVCLTRSTRTRLPLHHTQNLAPQKRYGSYQHLVYQYYLWFKAV